MNKCNCQCDCNKDVEKNLTIVWRRLISQGSTCPRCGSTEDELDKAVIQLKQKLNPLGIEVILQKEEITLEEFKKDPLKSNQILLNGQLLDDIIKAKTGESQCCDVCGDEKCRTVEVGNKSYETIPYELIIDSALKVLNF
ncbi:MAG: DUF2703 domain-containing protein [Patescibacteria group bacterium]|nr:DUF2703 domain-containing protein [Patescibacteria group bacterium]MDD4303974.1 DUF2703 domain-containing protein [Patescibacteria group bacterium]MDD4695037.1 DUF2703 domain-containing protein [Patescibacteria group bacterium]